MAAVWHAVRSRSASRTLACRSTRCSHAAVADGASLQRRRVFGRRADAPSASTRRSSCSRAASVRRCSNGVSAPAPMSNHIANTPAPRRVRAWRRRTASGLKCSVLAADGKRETQHVARVARVDDAVVQHARRGHQRALLAFEVLDDLRFHRVDLVVVHVLAFALHAAFHDDRHGERGLLGAHHRGLRVRPGKEEARVVAAAAHAVVAGAEGGAAHAA